MIDDNLRSLMEQCNRHVGRGNMIAVNQTMLMMFERLAEMIKQPCQCACGNTTVRVGTTELPDDDDEPVHEAIVVKRKVGRPRRVALTTEPTPESI